MSSCVVCRIRGSPAERKWRNEQQLTCDENFRVGCHEIGRNGKKEKKNDGTVNLDLRLLLKMTLLLEVFAGGVGVILPGKLFEDYGELS